MICTILLSGTVLGTASMSTPEGIDKRTNQLCNEILVTPFAYGPCLFSNNTQKLLNKFDDERLYKVLNDSNIDGDIVKQISANVRNFFTDKFCPTVHTAIVIEQQQECAAYRRYSRLLQSWVSLVAKLGLINSKQIINQITGLDNSIRKLKESNQQDDQQGLQDVAAEFDQCHREIDRGDGRTTSKSLRQLGYARECYYNTQTGGHLASERGKFGFLVFFVKLSTLFWIKLVFQQVNPVEVSLESSQPKQRLQRSQRHHERHLAGAMCLRLYVPPIQ